MSCSAVRTLIGLPSASSTAAYLLKMAMPGPMMAWDRSTGATGRIRARRRGHGVQRLGQHRVQFADEVAAGNGGASAGRVAADQDDAGGQGVGAGTNHAVAQLCAHRPSAVNSEAGAQHGRQEGLPAGSWRCLPRLGVGLLEGVVDRDRKGRMCLLGQVVHGRGHAVQKEGFGLPCRRGGRAWPPAPRPWARPPWRTGREDGLQALAQPDIEEIGQIGVSDVVVVRRISRNKLPRTSGLICRIYLTGKAVPTRELFNRHDSLIDCRCQTSTCIRERI
jgi:hypothetical protein